MPNRLLLHAVSLAALGLLGSPGVARAGELDVSPVVIELSAESPSTLLSVRNAGKDMLRFQVRAFAWNESPTGEMQLARTSEVIVYPPVGELAPGQARNLRVGVTAHPGPRERTWRIFLEEIPSAATAQGPQVQVRTRIGIPIFLAPAAPGGAKPEITGLALSGGHVRFALRNAGEVHFRPSSVQVVLADAAGATVAQLPLSGWYVLAGGERLHDVAVPKDACARAATVTAMASLENGAVQAKAPVASGACAP